MTDFIKIRSCEKRDFKVLADRQSPWDFKDKGEAWLEWLSQYKSFDRVSLVATLDDAIIGYYVTITIPLKIENRIVHSYRGGIFVHPDHRKKNYNVLNLLVRAVHEEIRKREGAVYAFPISRLMKYYTHRIKFEVLKPIPRYVCVLRIATIFERILKSKKVANVLGYFCQPLWPWWLLRIKFLPEGITINEIHFFDERFDRLWDKASKNHKIIATRDAEYLNWRYTKEPGQQYVIFAAQKNNEILGYIILKPLGDNDKKTGILIDLFGIQDKVVTKALALRAVQYFISEGADKLECYLSDKYYEGLLKSVGFIKKPDRPKAANVLIAKSYSPTTKNDVFGNPRHWFITTTDMIIA